MIGVALGAVAASHFPSPEQSVWTKDKHDWIALPASMRAYDVNPPAAAIESGRGYRNAELRA